VLVVFLYFVSCPLIIFLTFLTYVQLGNTIDAAVAFSTIMIFNILQAPLRQFPSALSSLIQMFTSVKRIEQFLLAVEIDNSLIHSADESDADVAIRIEEGSFRWGVEEEKRSKSLSPEVVEYRRRRSVNLTEEDEDHFEPINATTVDGKGRTKGSSSEIST
jgi:ABC-type multidrug transport system fused ATPase/permease subunit